MNTAAVVVMAVVEADNRMITAVGCVDSVLFNGITAFVVLDCNPVGETGEYPAGIAVLTEAIPDRDVR